MNVVLDSLEDDDDLNSFEIPSQGLEKLSSDLERGGNSIQSRWKYTIRAWIQQDQDNKIADWHTHGKTALDRRTNITRYYKRKIKTHKKKT